MREDRIDVTLEEPDGYLAFIVSPDCDTPYVTAEKKTLTMSFRGRLETPYPYALRLASGFFEEKEGTVTVRPEDGRITFLPFNAVSE